MDEANMKSSQMLVHCKVDLDKHSETLNLATNWQQFVRFHDKKAELSH